MLLTHSGLTSLLSGFTLCVTTVCVASAQEQDSREQSLVERPSALAARGTEPRRLIAHELTEPLQGWDGSEEPGTQSLSVDMGTGAFSWNVLEIWQPGVAGLDLRVERMHRSNASYNGPLGWNWDSPLFMRVSDNGAGSTATLQDGRFNSGTFTWNSTNGGVDSYNTPDGWFLSLTRTGSGPGAIYSALAPQGTVFRFEYDLKQAGQNWYRLKYISDTDGNALVFAYGANGLLQRVTDTVGNTTAFGWILSGGNPGRLRSVTAAGGASLNFSYDASGRQVRVDRPAPDGAGGVVSELMSYDSAGRLASITNPGDSGPWLVNTYNGGGRVVAQQQGTAGQISTWDWSAWPVVSRTDRLGQVTDYVINPITGLTMQISVRDMDAPGNAWTSTFQYDAHRHLVLETKPDGQVFEWTYENSSDPLRNGNLIQLVHKQNAGASGGLTHTWSYTSDWNKLAWEMTPHMNALTGGVFDSSKATVISYDSLGHMTMVSFPVVNTLAGPQVAQINWTYDARGRVATFTDARGLVTSMQYDDIGLARPFPTTVVSDPAGAALTQTFVYDGANLMASTSGACACNGGSSQIAFAYDANRRLHSVVAQVDAAKQRWTWYEHDAQGRLISTRVQDDSPVGDGWAVSTYAYDTLGNLIVLNEDIDAGSAAVTSWSYDAEERLLQSFSPEGRGSSWVHDERHLVVESRLLGSTSTSLDDVVTLVQHDTAGNLARIDKPDGTWEVFGYDPWGRLASAVDQQGRVTSYTYDEDGRMLSEEVRSAQNALLDRWNFSWDERGRLTLAEQLAVDAFGVPLGGGDGFNTLRVERDAGGLVMALHRENGTQVDRSYDIFGRMLSERDGLTPASGIDIDYHPNGLPQRLFAVEGDPATGLSPRRLMSEWISYDAEGRPLQIRDGVGESLTWEYTLRGDARRIVDRSGRRADITWDEARRMRSHARPLDPTQDPADVNVHHDYAWDADGQLVSAKVRNMPFGPNQTTFLNYDLFGQLDAVVWPDGTLTDYEYDAALRLDQSIDPRGTVVQHVYDAFGRLSDRLILGGLGVGGTTQEHYEYDDLDRLTLARNDDYEVTRSYSSLGSMEQESILDLVLGVTRSSRASYDATGRLDRLRYPSHTAAEPDELLFAWDGADRLTALMKQEGKTLRTVAQFEWMGDRLLKRWGPTVQTLAGWDGLGRLASLEHQLASSTPIARFDMRYDETENVTGVLRTFYDASGQDLPDFASGGYGGGLVNSFDAVHRLERTHGGIPTANWLSGSLTGALLQIVINYDLNENRVLTSQNAGGMLWSYTSWIIGLINEYVLVGGKAASYDAAGNLLAMPGGLTVLSYDFANRPLAWSKGGVTDTARYDAFGRRISTSSSDRTEVMTWFDAYALEQIVVGLPMPIRQFVYGDGLDETLEVRDVTANAVYPMVADNLGSPVALLSSGGTVIESYRYSTFGRRLAASPTTGAILPGDSSVAGNPVAFSGRWTMNGSDQLLDFRARVYLPDWGRFAQPDPLGYPNGRLNRYQLSGNDPYRKDNFGLFDDGHPTDPPNVNTHVGQTKQAGLEVGFDASDTFSAGYWNWYQDDPKSGNKAGLRSKNNFKYHALGRTQAKQEARLRALMDAATGAATGACNMRSMGQALHYAQDMVAHRTLTGGIYGEKLGHAAGTAFGFDPDGPEDASGNTWVRKYKPLSTPFGKTWVRKNPHGYQRHLRKLRAIVNSGDLMKEFMKKCGPGQGQALWPRYAGGKPKPATTGGKKKGPTTPRSDGKTDKPRSKAPTTPGPDGPTTPGPSGPTTPGPSSPGPTSPGPAGPISPGPSGPSTPIGPAPADPQGPTTPGPSGPSTPGPSGPTTGPDKPKGPWTPGGSHPTTPSRADQ
jgi:RHS repeat-associated protein